MKYQRFLLGLVLRLLFLTLLITCSRESSNEKEKELVPVADAHLPEIGKDEPLEEPPEPPQDAPNQRAHVVMEDMQALVGSWGVEGLLLTDSMHMGFKATKVVVDSRESARVRDVPWAYPYPYRLSVVFENADSLECGAFERLHGDWRAAWCRGGAIGESKAAKQLVAEVDGELVYLKIGTVMQLKLKKN